nr:TPA_asm: L [Medicago trirhavirus 1]
MDDYDYILEDTDEFEGGDDYDFSINKTKSLRPFHLNTALTPHWWNDLKLKKGNRRILSSMLELESVASLDSSKLKWSPIQFFLLFGPLSVIVDPLDFSSDALQIAETLDMAEQVNWQGATEFLNMKIRAEMRKAMSTPAYRVYNLQSNMFSTIVSVMNALASERNIPPHTDRLIQVNKKVWVISLNDSASIYLTDNLALGLYKDSWWIMNYDSILMCSDLAKQRRLVMGMTYVGNLIFPENYPSQSHLGKLFDIIDQGMVVHGNEFYKVVKTFEPLCVGAIMKTEYDAFVDNDEFFSTMFNALHEENPQFDYFVGNLTEFLTSEKNPRWLAQYFGLYRIWGHPIVDVDAGIKKVMDIGLKVTHVNDHTTLEAERHFKWIFMSNYKKKNHVYPNITVLYKEDSWLIRQIKANKDLPKPGSKWYLHELDCFDFSEVFKPPATFNLTSIIADKAVSPSRTELRGLIKQGKNMDPSIRRGVLKWLNQESVSCKEILKMVNNNEFPDDWCIIGVYPKEREENIKPRLFALMSFELRIYVVVTEEMLSDNILEYFPQITMTHSQLDLTKNIFTATRHQSTDYSKKTSNIVTVSLSMDFEKWNIMMRKEATFKVFRQLGLLFGMENLYTATHDLLSRCYIYLADGSYTPDESLAPDFKRSWIGQLGGFEGLRQKGWTIFTACVIDYVCSKKDVSFKLMGQGDNQVVQLIFRLHHTVKNSDGYHPKDVERIKRTINVVLEELDTVFDSVGMKLKVSETWKSSHLFSYGKNMVFNGVPLPLSLKKSARSFYESNEGVMVIDSMLATINTNCQAAAYQDISHHLSYYWARYESYIMIRRAIEYHPLLGTGLKTFQTSSWTARGAKIPPRAKGLSSHIIAGAMVAVPRMMGGFNTTCLFEYIMRGFPDPVTRDLRYLNLLLSGLSSLKTPLAKSLFDAVHPWYVFSPNGSVDKTFLIQDPLALNLLGPRSPMDAMRAAVEDLLMGSPIANKPFRSLIALKNKSALAQIAETLWSSERVNSRLGHDIYQATPYGYVTQSLSRIENSTTIRHIAYKKSSKDIIEVIGESEVNKYLYFCWKCAGPEHETYELVSKMCTRRYANNARAQTWGKEVVGVTVPFPDEYLEIHNTAHPIKSGEDDGYFVVGFNEHSVRQRATLLSSLGPSPPYLGSVTREKTRQTADATVFKAESLLRRPLKLQRAIGWFIPAGSNMANLIHQTLSCVSDLTPDEFETTDWESTGSHIHRYHDTVTKKGVLINYSYLPGTHMYLSSDLLIKYSQSKANVNIVYQACLVYQQYLAWILQLERIARGGTPLRALTWTIKCDCVQEIDEKFDDISEVPSNLLPTQKGNDLLWVSKSELIVHHSAKLKMIRSTESVAVEEFDEDELKDYFHIAMAKRIASDIYSGELTEDVESRMVDSVGRYPRVYYAKLSLHKLATAIIIWLKVFLIRRLGVIKMDISKVISLNKDVSRKLEESPILNYQGLGMFYTNREFTNYYLKLPAFPRPDQYPYSLRSVSKAMKEFMVSFFASQRYVKLKSENLLPVEFTNLEDETKNVIYFRHLRSQDICISCICEISHLGENDFTRKCRVHHKYKDLMNEGKLMLKYIPVTVDKLSKLVEHRIYKAVKLERSVMSREIPRSCPLLVDIKRSIRAGNDIRSPINLAPDAPKMGSVWQKYWRAAVFPTASRYKWTTILAEGARRFNYDNILIFGDGLGGVSDLCNIFWPYSKLTIISYMDVSDAINHSTIGCIPPEYQGDTDALDVYYQANVVNDVLSDQFVSEWNNKGEQFPILISDVELSRDLPADVYQQYICNITAIRPQAAIIKSYIRSVGAFINISALLCSRFDVVDVHTCATANLHFNEVFFICRGRTEMTNCWLFSLSSFESKVRGILDRYGPSTWRCDRDVMTLERLPWIKGGIERSVRLLISWFARFNLDHLMDLDQPTAKDLTLEVKRLLRVYRSRAFGVKSKIPFHIMIQIAQRIVAIAVINMRDVTALRDILSDPSIISIYIQNKLGMEEISFEFTGKSGSNNFEWGYAMKYVAIGRRAKGLTI